MAKVADTPQTPQGRLIRLARSHFTALDALAFLKKVSLHHRISLRMDAGLDVWEPFERLVTEHLSDLDAQRYADVVEQRRRAGLPLVDLN